MVFIMLRCNPHQQHHCYFLVAGAEAEKFSHPLLHLFLQKRAWHWTQAAFDLDSWGVLGTQGWCTNRVHIQRPEPRDSQRSIPCSLQCNTSCVCSLWRPSSSPASFRSPLGSLCSMCLQSSQRLSCLVMCFWFSVFVYLIKLNGWR